MSCVAQYKLGGLESSGKERKLTIDDTNYILNDKFVTAMRDTILDWETFLEIYEDNVDICTLFNQAAKLLDLKDNEHLRRDIILTLKSVYELPLQAHLTCMLKQYVLHEPISIVIYNIFIVIKIHYEKMVLKFLELRNEYIGNKKDAIKKDINKKDAKLNDIDKLFKVWADIDQQYDLQTSSIVLFFMNPSLRDQTSTIKIDHSKIHWKVPNMKNEPLINAVKKYKYKGFCKRVPRERLMALLEFPAKEFITAIRWLEERLNKKKTVFPQYSSLNTQMKNMLHIIPKPDLPTDLEKPKESPEGTALEKGKFYVKEILELRKKLLPYGLKYEEYYNSLAEQLVPVYELLKAEL